LKDNYSELGDPVSIETPWGVRVGYLNTGSGIEKEDKKGD